AGLTGAIVVLPQGVAFATLAGLPPQHGLWAAMLPCIVAALFGSSRLMVTGPANAISLSTLALLAPLATPFTPRYVELAITLAFLVGMMQVLLGLARVGRLVDKVPQPVVVGFTAGAALLIVNAQLGTLLGLSLPGGGVAANLHAAVQRLGQAEPAACLVSAATCAIALGARRWNRWVPSMLLAVVGGSLLAAALPHLAPQWPAPRTVGALSSPLPELSLPDLSLDTLRALFGATLVMTLLALTEASAIARAVARRRGDHLDGNQEFIGQGLANFSAAFTSGFPCSGSFNRSGVNVESGARTPLAAVCASLFLLAMLAFVAPLSHHLPLTVIAGLLVAVAWGLVDRPEIRRLLRGGAPQWVPLLVTFVATVTLSLEWAIVLGLASAPLAQAWRPGHPRG
ncbi:MAG: SulP family inorganic anion transporter, partial [Rubrivivax sp.]